MRVLLTSFSDPVADHLDYAFSFQEAMKNYDIEVDLGVISEKWMGFQEKAEYFNAVCSSDIYDWMIDLSGGNLANGMLPWVDFEAFALCHTQFMGFSDLSSLMNALAFKSGKDVFLLPMYYQQRPEETARFLLEEDGPLKEWNLMTDHPHFQVHHVYGGNLRCFLKLAGTPYWPNLNGCTLFLEGNSTSLYELISLLTQLKQTGAFEQADNVIFGCFNRLFFQPHEKIDAELQELFSWILAQLDIQISFGITRDIGHISNSAGLWI